MAPKYRHRYPMNMSSGEPPLDSNAADDSRPRKDHTPAWWALVGALVGSLVSGGFSLATATMTGEATEKAAQRAQQASEKALEVQRRQRQEEFLREHRVQVFEEFLADSQIAEAAQSDYLAVISSPDLHPPGSAETSLADLTAKHRKFITSFWSIEFFAPAELKDPADDLTGWIEAMYNDLSNYRGDPSMIGSLTEKMREASEQMGIYRLRFTSAARGTVAS